MADRNPSDLDREQRGSSNPNQSQDKENRSTRATETGISGSRDTESPNRNREGLDSDQGVGSESEDGVRSTGNIEGDDKLNR